MKPLEWIILLSFMSTVLYSDDHYVLFVTYLKASVYSKDSAFSPQIKTIDYSTAVRIKSAKSFWVEITTLEGKELGYIHRDALIDRYGLYRQDGIIETKKQNTDEVSDSTKGFSSEPEVFERICIQDLETKINPKYSLREKYPHYRYDLVDDIDKRGYIQNIQTEFKLWRKEGKLGEFSDYFQNK